MGGSARRPDTGGDVPGHSFCYCPGSCKRKRRSGAFCYCHPDSKTDEDEDEGDEQHWLLNTPRRKKLKNTSNMFSGSWKKFSMNIIQLEIPDQNIDIEALQVAFGSLHPDDVLRQPSQVIAILAAACMLLLDGLIQQCDWLSSVYKQQWLAMLWVEQDSEEEPQEINKEELEGNSMICGRKFAKDGEYCWW
ncbi:Germ cell-less protein-like 1 [Sciurus carolinensis]|uniref:Germ cell-less protein-like 1 n=1 Tax=Sciurus carolinensis TaxID=30640 RepID=A0AA41N6X5_SCICA|nr:Germ cell-less protein-like 1 [Sciurus carolinensis]